jgi:hypothetical protein
MLIRSVRYTHLAAIVLSSVLVLLLGLLGLRWGHVEAQGIMAAPACQCSTPTSISSISTNVVHCLCGGMSCVISEHTGQGKNSNLMQCVK